MSPSGSSTLTPTFEQILNFRDVGSTIRSISSTSKLRDGILYRSARPDNATGQDRTKLTRQYGVQTILDLRSKTEHINAAKRRSDIAGLAQPSVIPSSDSAVATPLKIPGIRYEEISLTGKSFERALMWKMSWGQIGRLVSLMAMGYRTEGISVLGKNVMQPRGLVGLGKDTLDYSGKEIKEVFDVLADEQSYPVVVHCTQGKDRTGLVILLVLLLCGIEIEAISQDYTISEKELEPEMKERLEEIASIGLDSTFAGCPTDFVEKIVAYLDERYGGVKSYLISVRVDEEQQNRIRAFLETGS
jgi:protein-tyrosine phosphatase